VQWCSGKNFRHLFKLTLFVSCNWIKIGIISFFLRWLWRLPWLWRAYIRLYRYIMLS
jgi:hypothetical protein